MNALQVGQQYSLSTKGENSKSLFFVKLTDSALQSIEMYLESKGDSSFKPTIQFQDNSGTISLPVNGRNQNYGFTLSKIETNGLQSSFQCLQHTCNRSLKSLGIMLKRMHIHAKEDSYEKTKFKMAAADKEQKRFCTKEIKSNGALLARKLKMKHLGLVLSPEKFHPATKKPEPSEFNIRNKLVNSSSVLQQPVRKRIVHILAIKPYKKPELLLRLKREGIIEKDKKDFNTILTCVGTLKGNVYNLASHLWNEVQENWEFCTKEELQLIQRRKQQFLRLNSENEVPCSKTQDNCSVVEKGNSSESIIAGNEPFSKKRRISHNSPRTTDQVIKDISFESNSSSKIELPALSNSDKLFDPHLQVNGNCNGTRQRNKIDSVNTCGKNKLRKNSDQINFHDHIFDTSHDVSSKKQSVSDNSFKIDKSKYTNSKNYQQEAITNNSLFNNSQNRTFSLPLANSDSHSGVQAKKRLSISQCEGKESRRYDCSNTNTNVNNQTSHTNHLSVMNRSEMISPVSDNNSSDSSLCHKDSKKYQDSSVENPSILETVEFDYSDCIQRFNTVESKEQRSQYAKEFNTQYEEYLKLHAQMKDISQKFAYLEKCLHACEPGSSEFKKIRAKIQKESRSTLQNSEYIQAWKKFNFLQSKLSHIKRLIKEYDSSQCIEF